MCMSRNRVLLWECIVARGGGMIACGNHLGVFVGERDTACPAGWVFVDVKAGTPEVFSDALDCANAGREEWPRKD